MRGASGGRGLAVAAAVLLLAPPAARADAATQALSGLGMALLGGICLFRSAQIEGVDEMGQEGEGAATAETPYAHRGAYGALGASFGFERHRDLAGRSVSDSAGWKARLGRRCSPHFAADLDFEWVEGFDVGTKDAPLWALMGAAKFHLLTGRVQPFALLGSGFLSGDVPGFRRRVDVALRFGGGVDWWASERLALSVDASYVLPTGSVKDLRYVSLGASIQYRF